MEPNEVIERFKKYNAIARENHGWSSEQVSIDTMTLAILDGDVDRFNKYYQAARENHSGSSEQVAVDTLNMALMDRTQGRGGLVAYLLTPRDRD